MLEVLNDRGRIPAIRRIREMTGLGLRPAMDIMDALAPPSKPEVIKTGPELSSDLLELPDDDFKKKIQDLIDKRHPLEALKEIREYYRSKGKNISLLESKALMDLLFRKH